jgi:hypothetical protein
MADNAGATTFRLTRNLSAGDTIGWWQVSVLTASVKLSVKY